MSILPEPVERPLSRYLHKYDEFYDRIVPDWQLQYKTVEQQYLYQGDFSVFVREITPEGCIVQDAVTGVFGFIPASELHEQTPVPGTLISGARCTAFDDTVIQSPALSVLRLQTGIVYEWDEAAGEGYIIPNEEQMAWNMLRVFRRDILWHGARRLFVGQLVQFETAVPGEVPIEANDDRSAPFALRVRSPEMTFSFKEAFIEPPEGAGKRGRFIATSEKAPPVVPLLDLPEEERKEHEGKLTWEQESKAIQLRMKRVRHVMPAESGRPALAVDERDSHPVLLRWLEQRETSSLAESPAWLWEAPMRYREDESTDLLPVIPLQLEKPDPIPRVFRVYPHEEVHKRGEGWKEEAYWKMKKNERKVMVPPNKWQLEKIAVADAEKRERARKRDVRAKKLRVASLQRMQKANRRL